MGRPATGKLGQYEGLGRRSVLQFTKVVPVAHVADEDDVGGEELGLVGHQVLQAASALLATLRR